jgi:hypothetical protein
MLKGIEKENFEKVLFEMGEFKKIGTTQREVTLFLLGMCAMLDMAIDGHKANISEEFREKLYEYAEKEKNKINGI